MDKRKGSPTPTAQKPFSFRTPKAGTIDPYFGAARTFWIEHTVPSKLNNFKPPIKSIVIKQRPDATRGIRFIVFESAEDYFRKAAGEKAA